MKNNKGFSLVELIVVIAIMAILAAVAVVGVSVYIPKARQAADEQLVADIKYAMNIAAQSGQLTPGDYVVIYMDKDATCGNNDPEAESKIDAALAAVFGEDWKTELRLSWDGWESGPAGDASVMQNVQNSNFKREEMDSLLGQVQTVVDAFSDYMIGSDIDTNSPSYKYLQMAGYTSGEITEKNAQAVGNAAVFGVSEQISGLLDSEESKQAFLDAWQEGGDFSQVEGMDAVSRMAARYAYTLAIAKHADALTNSTTYSDMLTAGVNQGGDNETLINNNMNTVLDAIGAKMDGDPDFFGSEIDKYMNEGQSNIDANAFLAYMDGVTTSSGSILGSNDLGKQNFFSDGNVLNYVDNYFDASDYLQNATDGAIVFIYNGSGNIFCTPDPAFN